MQSVAASPDDDEQGIVVLGERFTGRRKNGYPSAMGHMRHARYRLSGVAGQGNMCLALRCFGRDSWSMAYQFIKMRVGLDVGELDSQGLLNRRVWVTRFLLGVSAKARKQHG